jgi:hypothetical protein
MRLTFYKINLGLEEGATLPITVATNDIQKIEGLVNANKIVWEAASGKKINGLLIVDTLYAFNMTEEEYQTELMYCDIVDNDDVQTLPV